MYEYKAKLVKVVDGDTVDLDVDLGFHMTARIRFRLARINTPEVRGKEKEAGLLAKAFVLHELLNADIVVKTEKTGKYGRWLGEIFVEGNNLNDALVKNNHAEYVKY